MESLSFIVLPETGETRPSDAPNGGSTYRVQQSDFSLPVQGPQNESNSSDAHFVNEECDFNIFTGEPKQTGLSYDPNWI